ncbi:hypothetical protein R3Q06_34120 [Rhodococcus erythropolis]|uniref:hypothetical protein n=1 Tax=Rhodococcus erythropolis TaxID=1833 RepID=UPI00294947E8|nr:hypothetical protein [Rhodococcus erythropolis]MDV6278452.1 hypothetical protein [Rhodococcus erythropolis]
MLLTVGVTCAVGTRPHTGIIVAAASAQCDSAAVSNTGSAQPVLVPALTAPARTPTATGQMHIARNIFLHDPIGVLLTFVMVESSRRDRNVF